MGIGPAAASETCSKPLLPPLSMGVHPSVEITGGLEPMGDCRSFLGCSFVGVWAESFNTEGKRMAPAARAHTAQRYWDRKGSPLVGCCRPVGVTPTLTKHLHKQRAAHPTLKPVTGSTAHRFTGGMQGWGGTGAQAAYQHPDSNLGLLLPESVLHSQRRQGREGTMIS